jgi:hypothetical protein
MGYREALTKGSLPTGGDEAANALACVAHAAVAAACTFRKHMHPIPRRQPRLCCAHACLIQTRTPLHRQHLRKSCISFPPFLDPRVHMADLRS